LPTLPWQRAQGGYSRFIDASATNPIRATVALDPSRFWESVDQGTPHLIPEVALKLPAACALTNRGAARQSAPATDRAKKEAITIGTKPQMPQTPRSSFPPSATEQQRGRNKNKINDPE
jgi:hypothetical protein